MNSMIPDSAAGIYPNTVQDISEIPAFVFRDHRWTVPILKIAAENRLLRLPVNIVSFDRHRDSLPPRYGTDELAAFRSAEGSLGYLIDIVANRLSPRDDDWICAGMELGLIADVIQFGSAEDVSASDESLKVYTDTAGVAHRIFYAGRTAEALSYKGAFAEPSHESAAAGLWDILGWDPARPGISRSAGGFVLDIDLDNFTICWETYTIPYTREVYEGEFLAPCQSVYYYDYTPIMFIHELIDHAAVITVACEPAFCGGPEKSAHILADVNDLIFCGALSVTDIKVNYPPPYPDE